MPGLLNGPVHHPPPSVDAQRAVDALHLESIDFDDNVFDVS